MMDGNAMAGAMRSGSSVGMLELEAMHNSHHSQAMLQHHHHQQQHHHMQGLPVLSTPQHYNPVTSGNLGGQENDPCLCFDAKSPISNVLSFGYNKGKSVAAVGSDDDEPSYNEDCGEKGGGKRGSSSPWHRMKWTDSMVKLLINIVFSIGDDGAPAANESCDSSQSKRKLVILQKKGKWKFVSQAMMDHKFFVSPQQCEDKFNDLNKRYKRLNDILGKGTACSVVESPEMLDSMDHIDAKSKEDVRKILSSKHLFYREMCAYHNGYRALMLPADFETPATGKGGCGGGRGSNEGGTGPVGRDENESDDDDDDDEYDDDAEEDDDNGGGGEGEEGREWNLLSPSAKRRKTPNKCFEEGNWGAATRNPPTGAGTVCDVLNSMQTGPAADKLRMHAVGLEERKLSLQSQALELERERFHWQKCSTKKDRELEKMRMENEKMKLANEQLALQLKQQELDIECKRSEASMASIGLILERLQQSKDANGADSKRPPPHALTPQNCRLNA